MVAHDLGDQRQAEAAAAALAGDERVEDVGHHVVWHPRAGVAHRDLERQADPRALPRHGSA
jgi:hypothetical protein